MWGLLCQVRAGAVWLTVWLTLCLIITPPWSFHWDCVSLWMALPIPALLNGFNHWFRFSYTVLVESVPLPLLWTPWFPWLTCLEAAVEMSCCPSHGPDPTFTLIGNKKMTWVGSKPMALLKAPWIANLWWNVAVWWWRTLKWRMQWFASFAAQKMFPKTKTVPAGAHFYSLIRRFRKLLPRI